MSTQLYLKLYEVDLAKFAQPSVQTLMQTRISLYIKQQRTIFIFWLGRFKKLLLTIFIISLGNMNLSVRDAQAQTPIPERAGYAIEYPRIFAEQSLFGIVHGIGLLTELCMQRPESAESAKEAFTYWQSKQVEFIKALMTELSAYHYGVNTPTVDPKMIAALLRLPEKMDDSNKSQVEKACWSFPNALLQPRYDLQEEWLVAEKKSVIMVADEVQARDKDCRTVLSPQDLETHNKIFSAWQQRNAPILEQAVSYLSALWPFDSEQPTFREWRASLLHNAKFNAVQCMEFSRNLSRSESQLDKVFRKPPPLMSMK